MILTHLVLLGFLSGAGGEVVPVVPSAPPPVLYSGTPFYAPQARLSDSDEAELDADEQDIEDIAMMLATFIRGLH